MKAGKYILIMQIMFLKLRSMNNKTSVLINITGELLSAEQQIGWIFEKTFLQASIFVSGTNLN